MFFCNGQAMEYKGGIGTSSCKFPMVNEASLCMVHEFCLPIFSAGWQRASKLDAQSVFVSLFCHAVYTKIAIYNLFDAKKAV